MKKIFITILLLLTALATSYAANKRDDSKKNDRKIAVKTNIDSRDYVIDVNMALPAKGRNVSLSSRYSITIKGDSLECYLPYFGRAYSIPYGGGEGLIFDTQIKDYQQTSGKRDVTNIRFNAQTSEDRYQFSISIYPDGASNIQVNPNNKQGMSFIGEMNLRSKKQDKE